MPGLDDFNKLRAFVEMEEDDAFDFKKKAHLFAPNATITLEEEYRTIYKIESHDPKDFFQLGALYGGISFQRIAEEHKAKG